ncbi:MAG TPA: type II toxin-antitoxin system VapC family toxin, partial [Candidatus Angelobacter sp.]|nr:type II toxin-antitoxin system VapC family toxin [Candidatus Angelobacter sp.]
VTFIWAVVSPERISSKAMRAMQNAQTRLELSAISLSEIAIKQALGKLDFNADDVRIGVADLRLRALPYTADHAYQLFSLPQHHADPFDRQIIAQALAEDIPVVTSDEKFRLYKGVQVIW